MPGDVWPADVDSAVSNQLIAEHVNALLTLHSPEAPAAATKAALALLGQQRVELSEPDSPKDPPNDAPQTKSRPIHLTRAEPVHIGALCAPTWPTRPLLLWLISVGRPRDIRPRDIRPPTDRPTQARLTPPPQRIR